MPNWQTQIHTDSYCDCIYSSANDMPMPLESWEISLPDDYGIDESGVDLDAGHG